MYVYIQINWDLAFFKEEAWNRVQTTTSASEALYTWGQIIGMHFGEKQALKSLKEGDIEPRLIKMPNGKEVQRYCLTNVSRTPYFGDK